MGPLTTFTASLLSLFQLGLGVPDPGPGRMLHAAYPGDLPANDPLGPVRDFEGLTGKGLAVVHWFIPLSDGFPTATCEALRRHGSLPMISVSPGTYSLEQLARGDGDAAMRRFAREAAAWGHPFILRWAWEMNGKSIPWSGLRSGGPGMGPARYVSVWRRLHGIGRQQGMTQASWMWCPDAWGMGPGVGWNHWREYWPGTAYVDWLGTDAYRWPTATDHPLLAMVDGPLAADFLTETGRLFPDKPVMIGETGTSNRDPASAAWVRQAFRDLGRLPQVRAICWFNKDQDGVDWQLRQGTVTTRAYRDTVASERVASRFEIAGP